MNNSKTDFIISEAEPAHHSAIAECQRENFSIPLSEADLSSFHTDPLFRVRVIKIDNAVAGHTVFSVIGDTVELISVAVKEDFRRKGLGEALIKDLLTIAKEENCTSVLLEVRESNSKAIALYTKLGFAKIAHRKDFYQKPREDGITMQATW